MASHHDRTGRNRATQHRLGRVATPTLRSWEQPQKALMERMVSDAAIDMGWGRLIFGQTFISIETLAEVLMAEPPGTRDIAIYLRDPHVLLSLYPQDLFLDPSHTYRIWLHSYRPSRRQPQGFVIRRIQDRDDAEALNRIYAARNMVACDPEFILDDRSTSLRTHFVAEARPGGEIIGTVTGVDHVEAFKDTEGGASLWCLAVDPQAQLPGVGELLVRQVFEHYQARGRNYVDLSVMHDNAEAIRLYDKLGMKRVPVFCVKRKNPINEPLFTPSQTAENDLTPYETIIIREARRRGISAEVLDAQRGYFTLRHGGRSIVCRGSLSEMTTAIAMSRCDDKRLTLRILDQAGLPVPAQQLAGDPDENRKFLETHGRVVVKPVRGEQGTGVSVDLRTADAIEAAIAQAHEAGGEVALEQFVEGEDLRVVVINDEVVAAAVRKPPEIRGTGEHTIRRLLEKYNRRRMAATGGESRVPLDAETERCIRDAGHDWDSVLPVGRTLRVRKTANLHTGGTIHDVTERLSHAIAEAAVHAARVIDVPVVGLDLLVPDVAGNTFVFIEANERPGLANHEPQPTAERFVDLLFPETADRAHRGAAAAVGSAP